MVLCFVGLVLWVFVLVVFIGRGFTSVAIQFGERGLDTDLLTQQFSPSVFLSASNNNTPQNKKFLKPIS
jgi:hypothetical protein